MSTALYTVSSILFGVLTSVGLVGLLLGMYSVVFDLIWTYLKGERHHARIVGIVPAKESFDGTRYAIVVRFSRDGQQETLVTHSHIILSGFAQKRRLARKTERYLNRDVLLFIRRREPKLLAKQLRGKTISFVIKNQLLIHLWKIFAR